MKGTPFNFDEDFNSEEEAMAFVDEVIANIAHDVSEDENIASVVASDRVKEVKMAHKVLKLITKGKNVDIQCELNAPYMSMGAVSITGKEIVITNPTLFTKISEIASNFEVYPKTNGTVQMNFTFHNLMRKAGD